MAWNLRRTNRAAGHDSARDRNERRSPYHAFAIVLPLWTVGFEADLRRRRTEFMESRESSGAPFAGQSATRCYPADGYRLESGRPDLLLHASEHQSSVRCDGTEVD